MFRLVLWIERWANACPSCAADSDNVLAQAMAPGAWGLLALVLGVIFLTGRFLVQVYRREKVRGTF